VTLFGEIKDSIPFNPLIFPKEKNSVIFSVMELNVVCRLLLIGTRDEGSTLHFLKGGLAKTVLPMIWAYIRAAYSKAVVLPTKKMKYMCEVGKRKLDTAARLFFLLLL
jgi:hypothetical protein